MINISSAVAEPNIDEIYGEDYFMKPQPQKPKLEIGIGSNFYYEKGFSTTLAQYPFDTFLKFSLTNKSIKDYVYRYFDNLSKLHQTKSYLQRVSSEDNRRPHIYFKTKERLNDFIVYLSKQFTLIEITSGIPFVQLT